MPHGTGFRSKGQCADANRDEVADLTALNSCQQSAQPALLLPPFGNRVFTMRRDLAPQVCVFALRPAAGRPREFLLSVRLSGL
jgi:hypothetical protein